MKTGKIVTLCALDNRGHSVKPRAHNKHPPTVLTLSSNALRQQGRQGSRVNHYKCSNSGARAALITRLSCPGASPWRPAAHTLEPQRQNYNWLRSLPFAHTHTDTSNILLERSLQMCWEIGSNGHQGSVSSITRCCHQHLFQYHGFLQNNVKAELLQSRPQLS